MINYFDWLPMLEGIKGVDSINGELLMFNIRDLDVTPSNLETMKIPHKFDFFAMMILRQGVARGRVNMEEFVLDKPGSLMHLLPGQIIQMDSISEDFDASYVVLSKRFIENLAVYINGGISADIGFLSVRNKILSPEDLAMHDHFIDVIRHIVRNGNMPYRQKVVEHVIMAIFYGTKASEYAPAEQPNYSNASVLSKSFLELVKENFNKERQLKFYSDKLCITPRYLSRVVKETTGSSAAEWIEKYVTLEARALLKSTNMTIQQISDELNFPSQTFFGKYFKRRVGMSPKEYRRIG